MDRKLLQYLVNASSKRARRMGALCRPRRPMRLRRPGKRLAEALGLRPITCKRAAPWPAPGEFLAARTNCCRLIAEAVWRPGRHDPVANRPAPTLVVRRHHHFGRRRHRERRQLRHDRLLGAAALLHRQRHPHFRRCALRGSNLMAAQGHPEPTAQAKVTDGQPAARYVIHTVGPIANGRPTDMHRRQLAECYRACLTRRRGGAFQHRFRYLHGRVRVPQEEAASIAVATVRRWLNKHPDVPMTVVFNVFSETDESLYAVARTRWHRNAILSSLNPMKKGAAMLK
ncbi:MAG: macro domain-containing protein [Adlercreutzia equolifaciens]